MEVMDLGFLPVMHCRHLNETYHSTSVIIHTV